MASAALSEQKFYFVHPRKVMLSVVLFGGMALLSLLILGDELQHPEKEEVMTAVGFSVFFSGITLLLILGSLIQQRRHQHKTVLLRLTAASLTLRYGLFYRHQATLPWREIRNIVIKRMKSKYVDSEFIQIDLSRALLHQRASHKPKIELATTSIAADHRKVLSALRHYWLVANDLAPTSNDLLKSWLPPSGWQNKVADKQFSFNILYGFIRILPFFCMFAGLTILAVVRGLVYYRARIGESLWLGGVFVVGFLASCVCVWRWIELFRLRKIPVLRLFAQGLSVQHNDFLQHYSFALAWADITDISIQTNKRDQYLRITPTKQALEAMAYHDRCQGGLRIPTWQIKGSNRVVLDTLRDYWQQHNTEAAALVAALKVNEVREKVADRWMWGIVFVVVGLILWMRYA